MLSYLDFGLLTDNQVERGQTVLLHAAAGTGKTTLLLNWLHVNSRGSKSPNAKYLTFEESEENVAKTYSRINNGSLGNVQIHSLSTDEELMHHIDNEDSDLIVIDSINVVQITNRRYNLNKLFDKITQLAVEHNKTIFIINQRTSANTPKGGTHGSHMVSAVWSMDRSILNPNQVIFKVVKDRYGARINALLEMTSLGMNLIQPRITWTDKDLIREVRSARKPILKLFKNNYKKVTTKLIHNKTPFSEDVINKAIEYLVEDKVIKTKGRDGYITTDTQTFFEKLKGVFGTTYKIAKLAK